MGKTIWLASSLAAALTGLSAPAAFANDPCGPLWVDDNGNPTVAYKGKPNPKNAPDCLLTKDNWNGVKDKDGNYIGGLSGNINDAMTQNQSQIWNGVKYKAQVNGADHQVWSPGLGSVIDDDSHWAGWTKSNGQMKTVAEKINDDSDRIDTKQDKITDGQLNQAKDWVNKQIATAAAGGAVPPSGGDIKPMSHITPSDTADSDKTAGSINNVIDGLNKAQGTATAAQLQAETNEGNIAKNTQAIAGKQDKITQAQIDKAKSWVSGQISAAAGSGGDCKACDTIKKISEMDADGNLTAKDATARATAGNAQISADKAQADASAALTGGADDNTARQGVAANTQAIYQANRNIADTSAADRSYTDQTAAKTLASANAYTDSRYNQLNGKLDKLRSRVDSGVAGATALASIPFSSLTKNSFGGSVAVANSKAAGSVGYQRNFSKRWSARGTVAFGDHYAQGGVGGSYNW